MQAIITKYLGPTNSRGSRVKAFCQAGQVTIPWDDALDVNQNHDKAATVLAYKLGWNEGLYGKLVGGALPNDTGNCYVFVKHPALQSDLRNGGR